MIKIAFDVSTGSLATAPAPNGTGASGEQAQQQSAAQPEQQQRQQTQTLAKRQATALKSLNGDPLEWHRPGRGMSCMPADFIYVYKTSTDGLKRRAAQGWMDASPVTSLSCKSRAGGGRGGGAHAARDAPPDSDGEATPLRGQYDPIRRAGSVAPGSSSSQSRSHR